MWREGGTRPSSEEHDFTSLSFFFEPLPSFSAPFVVPLRSCQTSSNLPDTDPIKKKKSFPWWEMHETGARVAGVFTFADSNSHHCLIS